MGFINGSRASTVSGCGKLDWGLSHWWFFKHTLHIFNWNNIICDLNQSCMIAIIFCTCHNSSAVVTCAKICSNYWNMVSIRAKGNNFSGWIMSAKYSVKWSCGDVNWQWFLRPLISPQTPPGRDNKVEHALVSKLLKSKRMGKKIWGFIWGSLMLIFQFQFGHIEKLLYFQNGSFQTWSSRDERMNACTLVLS